MESEINDQLTLSPLPIPNNSNEDAVRLGSIQLNGKLQEARKKASSVMRNATMSPASVKDSDLVRNIGSPPQPSTKQVSIVGHQPSGLTKSSGASQLMR